MICVSSDWPSGRRHREAGPNKGAHPIRRMGPRRHGRGAVQVDAQRQARIAEAEPVAFGWHTKIQTFHVSPEDGELEPDIGGPARDRERARVRERDRVDAGAGIFGRQRRIEGDVTTVEAVHDGEDIDADRQWPVGARRQLLRRCARGQEQKRQTCRDCGRRAGTPPTNGCRDPHRFGSLLGPSGWCTGASPADPWSAGDILLTLSDDRSVVCAAARVLQMRHDASRLNEAGFCRGGYFVKFWIIGPPPPASRR